jgi:hypothetical protein
VGTGEHLDDLVVKVRGGVQGAHAMLGRVGAHKSLTHASTTWSESMRYITLARQSKVVV